MSAESDCLAVMQSDSLGQEVPVKQIDRALAEMFSTDAGRARASLMNLAIYSESGEKVARNTELIQELTREHACRALLIVSQPEGERDIHAWVQAHCNIGSGGKKSICSEQVSFLLSGSTVDMVRNIVFAHLDTDLPLTFWWQGELSDVFEDRLYSRINRLIVDSRDWADPAVQFLRLSTAGQGGKAQYVLHDLAFTQSNQLREAVALCFEEPAALAEVDHLASAEICHARTQRMTAIWMAAWLARRLGMDWKKDRSSEDCLVFERHGGVGGLFEIRLTVEEADHDELQAIPPISRLSLATGSDGARFEITRTENHQGGTFWNLERIFPGRERSVDLWPIRGLGDVGLIGEILMRAGRNRVMGEILPLVRLLLTV